MTLHAPEPLGAHHVLEHFACGKQCMDDWLVRHALQAQGSGSARTFVVSDSMRVVGYFSLTVGQVDIADASARLRHGMGHYPIPVVVLARLAVDQEWHRKGLGAGMLRDAIARTLLVAEQAGIRAMLAHPLDKAAESFYTRSGFEQSPLRERQLLLLLKDARRTLGL